jgi:hypothetical protein
VIQKVVIFCFHEVLALLEGCMHLRHNTQHFKTPHRVLLALQVLSHHVSQGHCVPIGLGRGQFTVI